MTKFLPPQIRLFVKWVNLDFGELSAVFMAGFIVLFKRSLMKRGYFRVDVYLRWNTKKVLATE